MKDRIIALAKKNSLIAFLLVNIEYYFRWCRGHKDPEIVEAIEHYTKEKNRNNKKYIKHIVKDLLYVKYVNGFVLFKEYFMFGFDSKKRSERTDYVDTAEYQSYTYNLRNYVTKNILMNKMSAYNVLKDFYGRDCIEINGFDDYNSFVNFAQSNNEFLLKPIKGSMGDGIAKIECNDLANVKNLFFSILQKAPCILEGYIKQSKELALFNPSSVNTVRFVMFTHPDGSITDVYSMFRTGVGDTVIDNASMGGIACAVDTKTGIVISDGFTKTGAEHYINHPISNIQYKGCKIPRWEELKQVCYNASKLIPDYRLVGWDMALTDNGWVVIEVNSRPNINTIQMCLGHGLRDVIEKTVATL